MGMQQGCLLWPALFLWLAGFYVYTIQSTRSSSETVDLTSPPLCKASNVNVTFAFVIPKIRRKLYIFTQCQGQGKKIEQREFVYRSGVFDTWHTTSIHLKACPDSSTVSSFSSTSSPQQKNQSGDNMGIIIGSVTGAVVAIVIIVVAVLVAVRARSRKPVSALLTQDGAVDPENNTAEGPSQSIQDTGTVPENKAPRQTSLLTQADDGPSQTSLLTQEVTMVPENKAV
ncbi:hypothetical protein ACOMHN_039767 [Nucella lapillus]